MKQTSGNRKKEQLGQKLKKSALAKQQVGHHKTTVSQKSKKSKLPQLWKTETKKHSKTKSIYRKNSK